MIEEPVLLAKPAVTTVKHHVGMELIAVMKIIKGTLVLLLAVGIASLLDQDLQQPVKDWANNLLLKSDHRILNFALHYVAGVNNHSLEIASGVAFFYAALLLLEGIGLWLEKVWAEYLTVVVTASFIPFEIHELTLHATLIKVGVVMVNVAIVVYLIRFLWQKSRGRREKTSALLAPALQKQL